MKVIFMRACMREVVRSTKERKSYIREISSEVFTREKEELYQDGVLLYEGEFHDGLYEGNGSLYEQEHMIYDGEVESRKI